MIIYIISAQSINSAYAPSYTNLKDLRVCNKKYYIQLLKSTNIELSHAGPGGSQRTHIFWRTLLTK